MSDEASQKNMEATSETVDSVEMADSSENNAAPAEEAKPAKSKKKKASAKKSDAVVAEGAPTENADASAASAESNANAGEVSASAEDASLAEVEDVTATTVVEVSADALVDATPVLSSESLPAGAVVTDRSQTDDTDAMSDDDGPMEAIFELTSESGVSIDRIVEAVLFTADQAMNSAKIASIVGNQLTPKKIRDIVDRLNGRYGRANLSFVVENVAGGYRMVTRPEFAGYLQQLHKTRSESRLSPAALETLAVIAYKQPVVRAEVEAIRGVACGEVLRSLMERNLIKIVGRAEELGRPMLYGTTTRFLEVFGLRDLSDLPKAAELTLPNRPATGPNAAVKEEKKDEAASEETLPLIEAAEATDVGGADGAEPVMSEESSESVPVAEIVETVDSLENSAVVDDGLSAGMAEDSEAMTSMSAEENASAELSGVDEHGADESASQG